MEFKDLQGRIDQIERENESRAARMKAQEMLRYKQGIREIQEAIAHPVFC